MITSEVQAPLAPIQKPCFIVSEKSSQSTVEIGKIARLVLLDANPLDDISNIKRIDAVILNGKFFPKTALRMMLANVEKAANAKLN